MKICFYVGYTPPFNGQNFKQQQVFGSETSVIYLAEEYAKYENDVIVFVHNIKNSMEMNHNGVNYVDASKISDYEEIDKMIISRYVHFFIMYKVVAKETILWVHDAVPNYAYNGLHLDNVGRDFVYNLCKFKVLDRIVFVSEFQRQNTLKNFNLCEVPTEVIQNGIPELNISISDYTKIQHRLLFNADPSRGLSFTLDCFEKIQEKIPEASLVVFRKQEFNDEIINKIGKLKNVICFGKVSPEKMAEEYCKTDIWFYPTNIPETFCICALEAQKYGALCACTNIGGMADTVENRGIKFNSLDINHVVKETLNLMNNENLKMDLRKKGIEYANTMSWSNIHARWKLKEIITKVQICNEQIINGDQLSKYVNKPITLNDFFSKIYVINLKFHVNKRRRIETLFKSKNIEFEFIDAVYGEDYTHAFNQIKEKSCFQYIGEYGLWLTWKKIFKKVLSEDSKDILIFEDDVYFDVNFESRINKYLGSLPSNWKICLLGATDYNIENNLKSLYNNWYANRYRVYGTFAIGFSNHIVQQIYNLIEANKYVPVDWFYEEIRVNVCYPNIVIPDVTTSSIRSDTRANNHVSNMRWNKNNYINFVFIIPSYNNEKWIERNIKSIINQSYHNWRVIYINDCSTDRTLEKYVKLLVNHEHKFTLINNTKEYGQAYNRYMGYHLCNDDEYCILLDGDDWLADEYVIEYLTQFIVKHDVDVTYRNYDVYKNGKISKGYEEEDYTNEICEMKKYRNDIFRARHLRVIKAKYLKRINICDFLDQHYDFIECCTDLVETFASLEQCNKRHKKTSKSLMIYNVDNSRQYKTSEFNTDKIIKDYRDYIEKKVRSIKPYTFKTKKNSIVVINVENSDFKVNINKYLHEYHNTYDVLLWKFSDIQIFYDDISDMYDRIIYLDNYLDTKTIDYSDCKLTYIIANYNNKHLINDTLVSLENQSCKQFKVIILDDKSTDGSFEYLKTVIKNYSFDIKLYCNDTNIGVAHTLGNLIAYTETEYFAIIESDDTIECDSTKILLQHIEKYPDIGCFYTNFMYCDKDLVKLSKGFCAPLPSGKTNLEINCIGPMRVFNKQAYYKTAGYIESNDFKKGAEDKDIHFKMEEVCQIHYIDEYLYNYRFNSTSLTKKPNGKETCEQLFELAKSKAQERRKINNILLSYKSLNTIINCSSNANVP